VNFETDEHTADLEPNRQPLRRLFCPSPTIFLINRTHCEGGGITDAFPSFLSLLDNDSHLPLVFSGFVILRDSFVFLLLLDGYTLFPRLCLT
jgi:hypothetical protein